jgi:capsule polysaccharide export protein KpsE/RkpR
LLKFQVTQCKGSNGAPEVIRGLERRIAGLEKTLRDEGKALVGGTRGGDGRGSLVGRAAACLSGRSHHQSGGSPRRLRLLP